VRRLYTEGSNMAGIAIFFAPEIIFLTILGIVILILLLLHIRSLVRNALLAAAMLFAWATRGGFVGFAAYIAAWVFMFPVMLAICAGAGVVRTWLEARSAREARRQAKLASSPVEQRRWMWTGALLKHARWLLTPRRDCNGPPTSVAVLQ
jgi:hypothetical protein